jgi:hypothetical protein
VIAIRDDNIGFGSLHMNNNSHGFWLLAVAMCCQSCSDTTPAFADEFRAVTGEQGGEAVVGDLGPQASPQAALVSMLREVHQHFNARPTITSLLNDTHAQSMSAFFSETWKGTKIAGLTIVSYSNLQAPHAIIVYDSADRFPTTANALIQLAQHKSSTQGNAQSGKQPARESNAPLPAAQPLHQTNFSDNSGSIGLPDGWRIMLAYSGGVIAQGPNKEMLAVGNYFPAIDTSTPLGNQQVQMAMRSGRGLPGRYVAFPYTTDPAKAYTSVMMQRDGGQSPQIEIQSVQNISPGAEGAVALISGTIDRHDGAGPCSLVARVSITARLPPNGFGVMISGAQIPSALFRAEYNTMMAMFKSHHANNGVIAQETADEIGRIHAIGDAAREQARESAAASDARSAAFNEHLSDIDRQSAGFSDYLLENSVVRSSDGVHARLPNDWANALTEANPQRFEILPTSRYLQGIDY